MNLFSPVKKPKEPWSPKQKIWSGGKKRKAEEARLSSNEESGSKRRVDSKTSSITGSEGCERSVVISSLIISAHFSLLRPRSCERGDLLQCGESSLLLSCPGRPA